MNTIEIAQYANDNKACKPGLKKILESKNESELLELYKKNIDFCLSENFPDNDYLSQKVDSDLLDENGIFLNGEALLKNRDFIVLLGDCFAGIEITGYTVSQIFIKNNSSADISTEDNAFVVIDCFDATELKIKASGDSKVLINLYGKAKVTHEQEDNAKIKIVRKGKENY